MLEQRKTSAANIGRILIGGTIVAALLHAAVSEVALRFEWGRFDDERIALPLRSGAASSGYYHDPDAAVPSDPDKELKAGLKGPTTNLRERLPE